MGKIDKVDRKIIDMLLKNSRMSNLEVSKQLGLSHDAVRYRIEKLVRDGAITNFTINIDPAKLGLVIWGDLIISVWNLTPKRYSEFLSYLKNHPNVAAVWNLSGKYEWFIEVYTTDLKKFNEITNEIKLKFSDIIKDMETAFVLNELKPYTYPVS
ncbi:MAG: Lrp/AsnC family transcriptional regulator [DPANN group archaeon]|nr:Lrp/AsnC family transcriptional regulator [DPANN group archaeon]